MDNNRELLYKKILGEENFECLESRVEYFMSYLQGEFESIHSQKVQNIITARQVDVLVNSLYEKLEDFHKRIFPNTVKNLKFDLFAVDIEILIHDFNDHLYIYFNDTYLEKFKNK